MNIKNKSALLAIRYVLILAIALASSITAMDKVRVETGTDAAIARFGVSGRGVLVAVMDRGIDWKNGDFRNDDGTTRIQYIFDLTDDTGANAPGNSYKVGTIYTKQQIDAALIQGTALATRDAVGHGTTTTAIACGNGRNSPQRKYSGIAPNATIIAVKIVSDGAPSHDGEPAEEAFYKPERIPIAIDFIRDKAQELGLPCVMLLNIGSIGGPTDGTSELSRKIDATVGPGIPGLVFVTGTGDDGGMPNHAGGVVAAGQSVMLQIQKGSASPLYFDLWYGGDDRFDVTVQTPSGSYGPYISPATNNDISTAQTQDFLYYQSGADRDSYNATNGKREIRIRFDGPPGTYTVQLSGRSISSGRFDATLNPSNFWQGALGANRFLNFVVPGSIWDGASARFNITPNSYVIRTSWTDIDGYPRQIQGGGIVGELWKGSSVGPTFDGRYGVDTSAPGDAIVTTYNPKSYWATFRGNLIQDGHGLYGMAGAVSAASPIVTGIIALMLEANPRLDAASVKNILQRTARSDQFTGQTPNANWGYGKVDALAALTLATSMLQFSAANYSIAEGVSSVTITVTRSGDTSAAATVEYATTPDSQVLRCDVVKGAASERCDYVTTVGILRFAAGQSTLTITIPIIDDVYAEGQETFQLSMSNTVGVSLGAQATATLTIQDNDQASSTVNPIDDLPIFVRQQYLDFLSREPDPGGFNGWMAKLNQCPPSEHGNPNSVLDCTRIDVSSAFFRSLEFALKGYYVYRFYQVSFGERPQYAEFIRGTSQIKGATDEELAANRAAFPGEWVARARFQTKYAALTNAAYVDELLRSSSMTQRLAAKRGQWISELDAVSRTRAQVLNEIVESPEVEQRFYNESFVAMQYFGYLRRDLDQAGYDGWLTQLNRTGNYREMVWGFLYSPEHKLRFGPVPGY